MCIFINQLQYYKKRERKQLFGLLFYLKAGDSVYVWRALENPIFIYKYRYSRQ